MSHSTSAPGESPVYGGFFRRLAAFALDVVIIGVPLFFLWTFTLYGIFSGALSGALALAAALLVLLAAVLGPLAYYVFLGTGTTLGKQILGLRVVDARTLGDISTGQAIGRHFGYWLSWLAFYLGFVWILVDRRKQGWHDKLAGTVVIRV